MSKQPTQDTSSESLPQMPDLSGLLKTVSEHSQVSLEAMAPVEVKPNIERCKVNSKLVILTKTCPVLKRKNQDGTIEILYDEKDRVKGVVCEYLEEEWCDNKFLYSALCKLNKVRYNCPYRGTKA